MIIGYLGIEVYLPCSHSLKEKRKRLKRFKDRLKSKHNAAVAELDFHDKWQRSHLGIVTISNQLSMVEKVLQTILREAEETLDGQILKTEIKHF